MGKYLKKDNCNTVTEVVERNVREIYNISLSSFMEEMEMPYLNQLKEAADFIRRYIETTPEGMIHIIGDYDCDGITATAILVLAFRYADCDVSYRIPYRFSEGYGLNEKIIDEIDDGLIITVDNGIAAINAVKKAKEKGLKVVVTDHHIPVKDKDGNIILPEADVILDPHINPEKSEFEDYCGAGLAYRLAREINPSMNLRDLRVLASIATVADVMPLYGANRTLVRHGLEDINRRICPPGLKELLKEAKFDNHITEENYGFGIGPIFNGVSRLADKGATKGVRLLIADRDDPKLPFTAKNLVDSNNKRKQIQREQEEIAEEALTDEKPIVIYDENFGEGIIGLIAGKFCEKYNCPTIVFTKTKNPHIIKGSGRSIKEIHLKNALDSIQDKIVGFGGHAGAAGLSIEADRFMEFKKSFIEACGEIPEYSEPKYDLELNIENLEETMNEQNRYAPYGEGNPKLLYHIKYTPDGEYKEMGDSGIHFKLCDSRLNLMGFGLAQKYKDMGCPKTLDCIGYLSESWYNDKMTYQLQMIDFK